MRTIHPKHNLIYECKVCHQTFKDSQGVYRHVMLHSETEFFRHFFLYARITTLTSLIADAV